MTRKTTPSLAEATAEYQAVRATYVAPTTHYNDGRILAAFVRAIGPGKQVHTLTARQVELWFAAEAGRQKASSFNKVRTRMAGFFQFCARRRWLDSDVLGMVRPQRVVKRERLRLSVTELLDLPRHAGTDRDRAFLLIAMNTALRASDIASLRVRDVDLDGGWLQVRISKSSVARS